MPKEPQNPKGPQKPRGHQTAISVVITHNKAKQKIDRSLCYLVSNHTSHYIWLYHVITLNTRTLRVTIIKGKFDLKLNSKGNRGPYSVSPHFSPNLQQRDTSRVPLENFEKVKVKKQLCFMIYMDTDLLILFEHFTHFPHNVCANCIDCAKNNGGEHGTRIKIMGNSHFTVYLWVPWRQALRYDLVLHTWYTTTLHGSVCK